MSLRLTLSTAAQRELSLGPQPHTSADCTAGHQPVCLISHELRPVLQTIKRRVNGGSEYSLGGVFFLVFVSEDAPPEAAKLPH